MRLHSVELVDANDVASKDWKTAMEEMLNAVLTLLPDLRLTLSLLDRPMGQHLSVNEVDLDCLGILFRRVPHVPF